MNYFIKSVIYFLFVFILFNFNSIAFGYQPTISIDLDGVLDNYTKYDANYIPEIKQGAREFIQELHKNGYNIILFTNRKPLLASKWLIENNLDKYFSDVTNVKPIATMYIDDRTIKFNGNYEKTLNEIKNFQVYWKN